MGLEWHRSTIDHSERVQWPVNHRRGPQEALVRVAFSEQQRNSVHTESRDTIGPVNSITRDDCELELSPR